MPRWSFMDSVSAFLRFSSRIRVPKLKFECNVWLDASCNRRTTLTVMRNSIGATVFYRDQCETVRPQEMHRTASECSQTENIMMKPHITVSEQDLEQLESLLDTLPVSAGRSRAALLEELDRAEIVDLRNIPRSVVTMNSTVRFEIDSPSEEFCLTLTYPDKTGDTPGAISVLTPIGTALLGMSVGSEIEWPRPDGKLVKVRILSVARQPGHAGSQALS